MTVETSLMHAPHTHSIRPFVLAMVSSIALGGCAAGSSTTGGKTVAFDPEKRAVERSVARWKALTDKRFDEVFAFLSDASKIGMTASEYGAAMQRMGYTNATVERATCEEGVCTVKSIITLPVYIRAVGPRPQSLPVEERWIVSNGELWLIRR